MTTTSFINFVQNLVHAGSLIGIGVIAILIIAGLIRPSIFKRVMRSFTDRKYIAGLGIFLCLFSATVFVATDSSHHDFQQDEKKAPAQTGTLDDQPETSQPVIEEAQISPPSTPASAGSDMPAAVQGAQSAPEMGSPADEQSVSSANQTAQTPDTKPDCKVRLLHVCL